MARTRMAEEAILLASSNASVADYLVKRGSEAKVGDWSARSNISEEAEAVLLERGDRLIDLRLAEHCLFSSTAQTLFSRDPDDWALRSLVLSNEAIANGLFLETFPESLFGGEDGLKAYLSTIARDDVAVLFENPTLDDRFLENVLSLEAYWQAMPENSRRHVLSALGNNPKMRKSVSMSDHVEGWDWYMAGEPFHAAWRLVIELNVTADYARHLSLFYEHLAPYCVDREGIWESLPRWFPQTEAEKEEEEKNNKKGRLSSYQSIRRAAAAMLLGRHELKQDVLLQSDDSAVRCGAYVAGRFSPDEMNSAIERDSWRAAVSLMRNPNCWRTAEHRDALHEGLNASDDENVNWEYERWADKFAKDHPDWFGENEVDLEPEDRPLSESSQGDLARHVLSSPAFTSLRAEVAGLARSQGINFWLVVAILVVILFRL